MVLINNINQIDEKLKVENSEKNISEKTTQIKLSSLFSVSKITDNLYLCGACAIKKDTISKLGITCVINCTTKQELPDLPLPDTVTQYHRITVYDSPRTDLAKYFHRISDVIKQVGDGNGKTLVHCVAGVSRSASLCLAYLVKHSDMSLREAYLYLEKCRPAIRPNCGFFKQLIQFETEVRTKASVFLIFNEITKSYIPDVYKNQLRYNLPCLHVNCNKKCQFL